jgi:hypothetical protein
LLINAIAGWGGRTRTSEWRNQNLPDHIDLGTLFSQLAEKARMSHQNLSTKFPTEIQLDDQGLSVRALNDGGAA